MPGRSITLEGLTLPQYRIKEDRHGNPVVHAELCFCDSKLNDSWLAEADSLAELAESLEADMIEAGTITRAESHALMKIAHCIDNSHCPGVGRRYASYMPTLREDTFGEWARQTEQNIKPEPLLPKQLAFRSNNLRPGRPVSTHADCDHPRDRKSRAACRKQRAKNES